MIVRIGSRRTSDAPPPIDESHIIIARVEASRFCIPVAQPIENTTSVRNWAVSGAAFNPIFVHYVRVPSNEILELAGRVAWVKRCAIVFRRNALGVQCIYLAGGSDLGAGDLPIIWASRCSCRCRGRRRRRGWRRRGRYAHLPTLMMCRPVRAP